MQQKVKDFNDSMPCHKKPMPASARLLDISSEIGELAKEVLKASNYGTTDFSVTEDFEMELGDVLYSLLSLANETGVNSEKALDKILAKYKARIEKKGSMGSEGN